MRTSQSSVPLYFAPGPTYTVSMTIFPLTRLRRFRPTSLHADNKGPWGGTGEDPAAPGDAPKPESPWGDSPAKPRPEGRFAGTNNIEQLFQRGRQRLNRVGGGGGNGDGGAGPGFRPDASLILWALAALVLLWLVLTTAHRIAPEERGVVTRFGRYAYTLSPGVGLTLPSPIDKVKKVDVEKIQTIDLGSEESETLMLTGDGNIIDIAYQVRWNIRDPEQYLFELAQPEETIRQVAESAMRAAVANGTLRDATQKRGEIENRVQEEMQRVLDSYHAGILVQGIAIKQADPPAAVIDAFKEVSAAQQQAQSYVNQARNYSLQVTANAQGETAAFDKVYGQYKLAPDVTRRRMYYETMERVLQGVDKTIVDAPGVNSYQALPPVVRTLPRQEPGK